jgi:hypothetical protein
VDRPAAPRHVLDPTFTWDGVRGLAALALAVLLAGCSGGSPAPSSTEPSGSAQPVANGTPAVVAMPANVTTDLLHLRAGARLAASASANLTILATLAGELPQAFNWNTTLNGTGNLTHARLVLWLDLQDTAVQEGIGGDPGCTAALTLYFTLNGTQVAQAGGCASAGFGAIPPGEHRLELSTPLTAFPAGAHVKPGDQVLAQVAFGLALPQGVGHVLGGGDRDSSLRLLGLSEPVPPAVAGPTSNATA